MLRDNESTMSALLETLSRRRLVSTARWELNSCSPACKAAAAANCGISPNRIASWRSSAATWKPAPTASSPIPLAGAARRWLATARGNRRGRSIKRPHAWRARPLGSARVRPGRLRAAGGDGRTLRRAVPSRCAAALEEQALALVAAGVDAIIIETQTSLEELGLAIQAAPKAAAPCVIGSVAYGGPSPDKSFYVTMMGVSPAKAARFVR